MRSPRDDPVADNVRGPRRRGPFVEGLRRLDVVHIVPQGGWVLRALDSAYHEGVRLRGLNPRPTPEVLDHRRGQFRGLADPLVSDCDGRLAQVLLDLLQVAVELPAA